MNWTTILVLLIVVGTLAAIVAAAVRNKRRGRRVCACGSACSGCPMAGKCHTGAHPIK